MAKEKIIRKAIPRKVPEISHQETTEQTIQRIKRDMLWVIISITVAAGIGLTVGHLIKF